MGAVTSVEAMDQETLAAEAERAGVPDVVCAKIRNDIDGATALEYAQLSEDDAAELAKELFDSVSAVSVGIIDGTPMLDLAYVEDVRAETDMNVVVTGRGLFVEVQGTAEGAPFDKRELDQLLELGLAGCAELRDQQVSVLDGAGQPR